jgi:hypothetical protein
MNMVSLSALLTGRLYHPEHFPGTHFCYGLSRPQGHSAAGRIMSMENLSKVVSPTRRPPLPPGNIPGTHFCYGLSRPQGHSAAGRIMSMKNFNKTIGIQTRDLPACSAVPQSTAPPAACPLMVKQSSLKLKEVQSFETSVTI